MKLTRCENGHYYDADKFEKCPHCYVEEIVDPAPDDIKTGVEEDHVEGVQTVRVVERPEKIEPVTGWLVAIAGPHFGEDFRIVAGRNCVGRLEEMDIVLSKDNTVTREKHAVIVYDPRSNAFMVQSGYAKGLSYLNGKLVMAVEPLKPYDVLTLGKTELLFIPCCSKKFDWTMVQRDEEAKKDE